MSYFNYQAKNIFYKETGCGKPLIMLHGDTASSTMFEMLLPLHQEHFRVILIDFLGNGKSDRVEKSQQIYGFHKPNRLLHLLNI